MKKLLTVLGAGVLAVAMLAGCSKSEEEMKYLKDFDAKDYVELPDYMGIPVSAVRKTASEEDLQGYIDYILSYYTELKEITDRDDVQNGDVCIFDFVGKIDGEEFEGGSAEDYQLEIGSGQFIEGFEDGMVGMKVGETKDLNLKFPDNYGNADVAGKPVVFTVTVKSINEEVARELNDEFVQEIDDTCKNVDEFKNKLNEEIEQSYKEQYENEVYDEIQNWLNENAKVTKVPSGFSDRLYNSMILELNNAASEYQMDPGTIAQYYYGVDPENFEEEIHNYIYDQMAPQYIVMAAIASENNLMLTDEEVNQTLQEDIDASGAEVSLEEYKKSIDDYEAYREYLIVMKVLDFLKENAKVNEQ